MKRNVPFLKEDISFQPDQGKSTVNAVFERMMETATPMPFRTLVRNAAGLSSWQRAVRQHTQNREAAKGAPDELAVLDKLVRNALGKCPPVIKEQPVKSLKALSRSRADAFDV